MRFEAMLISEHMTASCSDLGILSSRQIKEAVRVHSLSTPTERLGYLLRGRKPYVWAREVALSRGAMDRLLKGNFPDPEKLVPACRVENISLTWWLEGIGSPYVVYIAASPDDHASLARMMQADEPSMHAVRVKCADGCRIAFWQHAMIQIADEESRRYTQVTMLGGSVVTEPIDLQIWNELTLDRDQSKRYARGFMGATEFVDLMGSATDARPGQVREDVLPYMPTTREKLVSDIAALSDNDVDVLARMVRGLK